MSAACVRVLLLCVGATLVLTHEASNGKVAKDRIIDVLMTDSQTDGMSVQTQKTANLKQRARLQRADLEMALEVFVQIILIE